MKKITQLLILLFVCMDISAQNMLYEEIQGAKDAKITFKKLSPILCETDRNVILSNGFLKPDDVHYFEYLPPSAKDLGEAVTLSVPIGRSSINL